MLYKEKMIRIKETGTEAKLSLFIWEPSAELPGGTARPLVLVCPGGGYAYTSDREAEPIAFQYMAMGYHAAILRYSPAPARFPAALLELAESVAYIRGNAEEWHVAPDKIAVQGFSAGGHLTASLGVFWKEQFITRALGRDSQAYKPNTLLLSYPVITSGEFAHQGSFENLLGDDPDKLREKMALETQVSSDTPPCFIWHTYEDGAVPVENSLLFVSALRRHNVLTEFHLYPKGGHGLALANAVTDLADSNGVQEQCQGWVGLTKGWLEMLFEQRG